MVAKKGFCKVCGLRLILCPVKNRLINLESLITIKNSRFRVETEKYLLFVYHYDYHEPQQKIISCCA